MVISQAELMDLYKLIAAQIQTVLPDGDRIFVVPTIGGIYRGTVRSNSFRPVPGDCKVTQDNGFSYDLHGPKHQYNRYSIPYLDYVSADLAYTISQDIADKFLAEAEISRKGDAE